ncbi:MAG: InlB B-repeat-containing protein [Oscillospiraceae bacterium]|nr:InlB B-repeat-containing protein [Oscillospiraceae bacterium]
MKPLCKKSIALLLSLGLCISLLPVSALAAERKTAEWELKILEKSGDEMVQEESGPLQSLLDVLDGYLNPGFQVTYCLGADMENKVYQTEDVRSGEELSVPEKPVREGYRFLGWYLDEACTIPWNFETDTVTDDMTLYAHWGSTDSRQLDLSRDTWHITNSPQYFDGNYSYGGDITVGYEMTIRDFQALVRGMTTVEKVNYLQEQRYSWGGSCFGMASAVVLAKAGAIDIADFPEENGTRYNTLAEANLIRNTTPETVGNIESMITYYFFRQYIGQIGDIAFDYVTPNYGPDSENLKVIVNKMRTSNAPTQIGILLIDSYYGIVGGHSVVGYDLETTSYGYTFKIYDNSFTGEDYYPVDVTVDNSGEYSAECPEWESDWGYEIFFTDAQTVQELQLHPILVAPGVATGGTTDYYSGRTGSYSMVTSYGDFTISNGTQSAKIRNGWVVSGDLKVSCRGRTNVIGAEPEYTFRLPVLSGKQTYTIRQETPGRNDTRVISYHPETGFFASQQAQQPGTITIGADGSINTAYQAETEQTLCTALNDSGTSWYALELEGISSGFEMVPDKEETAVKSLTEAMVQIRALSDFNEITMSDVELGRKELLVQEGDSREILLQLEDYILDSDNFGFSVAFEPMGGSKVETLTNVEEGSTIQKPADPIREGYTFRGWYLDEGCTKAWNFGKDIVTEDLILYAGWEQIPARQEVTVPTQPEPEATEQTRPAPETQPAPTEEEIPFEIVVLE